MHHKQQGMTLIEVMVASTILFSVLVLMSQVMGTALKSSEQAEKNINISYNMPFIIDEIKLKIDIGKSSGNDVFFNKELTYNWQANLSKQSPINKYSGINSASDRKVKLYTVILNIKYKKLEKSFEYMEVLSEK